MVSDWTSGRPALIIVVNCRVKITMSRVFTFPLPRPPRLMLFGASRTLTRMSRFFRKWALTSSLVLRSTCPFWICPFAAFRAVYSNSGIDLLPNCVRPRAHYVLPAIAGTLLLLLRRTVGAAHLLVFHRRDADHPQEFLGIVRDPFTLFLSDFTGSVELE